MTTPNTKPLLQAQGLRHRYGDTEVLCGVDLSIEPGEVVALTGKSGAGKSTLLHLLGTLDKPQAGTLHYQGRPLTGLGAAALARFRNRELGFVFQFHHLIAELTVAENVYLPGLVEGGRRGPLRARALDLLDALGLQTLADRHPTQLSGGEQQRVAVARALFNRPKLLLADEPTGNLDAANGQTLFELVLQLANDHGAACLLATHNLALANRANRRLHLVAGQWGAPEAAPLSA